jgi:4-hydroxybenzoate polyprenyltransferase/phosphoserine phosphatase
MLFLKPSHALVATGLLAWRRLLAVGGFSVLPRGHGRAEERVADGLVRQRMEAAASLSQGAGPESAAAQSESAVPLVVDLDGTLVSTDLLVESCFVLAKTRPLRLFRLPFWLARGPAWFKQRLAREAIPDVRTLPYNGELLAFLRAEKQKGRRLVLATGADAAVAREVAQRVELFDVVLASDGVTNLSGEQKRDRLIAEFGAHGFDYVGNSARDRSVWKAARKAILVRPTATLRRAAAQEYEVDRVFEPEMSGVAVYLQALRPHHWFKSALVFVPLIAAHQLYDVPKLAHAVLAFAALSLCASSVYLLNDLLDLPDDRRHPHKQDRMLASGHLPIGHAPVLTPVLLLGAALLSLAQPPFFFAVIGLYYLLMLAYCLKLRDLVAWDVLALAAGYSLRVVAGGVAADVVVSSWLMVSCFFLFLGLALLKRYSELVMMRSLRGPEGRVHAYPVAGGEQVAIYGRLSSYLALVLFAIYLGVERSSYARYELNWIFWVLLLFWVTRMWLIAGLGRIRNDPVTFALTDRVSQVIGLLMAMTVLVAV